jgi:hypothetical protein
VIQDDSSFLSFEAAGSSDIEGTHSRHRGLLQSGVQLTYSIFPAKFNEETPESVTTPVDDNDAAAAPDTGETITAVTLGTAEGASFDMAALASLAQLVTEVTSSLQELEIAGIPVDTSTISEPEVVEATPRTCVPICKVRMHAVHSPPPQRCLLTFHL